MERCSACGEPSPLLVLMGGSSLWCDNCVASLTVGPHAPAAWSHADGVVT